MSEEKYKVEIQCDVCGDNLSSGVTVIGIRIELPQELTTNLKEVEKVAKKFGRTQFSICYCCWLTSLGVKPLEEKKGE